MVLVQVEAMAVDLQVLIVHLKEDNWHLFGGDIVYMVLDFGVLLCYIIERKLEFYYLFGCSYRNTHEFS